MTSTLFYYSHLSPQNNVDSGQVNSRPQGQRFKGGGGKDIWITSVDFRQLELSDRLVPYIEVIFLS